MKKIFFISFLFQFLFFNLVAQNKLPNYKKIVGIEFSYSNSREGQLESNYSTSSYRYYSQLLTNSSLLSSLKFGKQLNPHWVIGFQFDYSRQVFREFRIDSTIVLNIWTRDEYVYDRRQNGIGGNIWARYTFNPAHKLQFFVQPSLGYQYLRSKLLTTSNWPVSNKERVNLNLEAGFQYSFTPHWRGLFRFGSLGIIHFREKNYSETIRLGSFGGLNIGAEYLF
ncbi:MAG: hypothetical protein RL757_2780 [Bacteroidota bacterium]|jgi:hypothetical protein